MVGSENRAASGKSSSGSMELTSVPLEGEGISPLSYLNSSVIAKEEGVVAVAVVPGGQEPREGEGKWSMLERSGTRPIPGEAAGGGV